MGVLGQGVKDRKKKERERVRSGSRRGTHVTLWEWCQVK